MQAKIQKTPIPWSALDKNPMAEPNSKAILWNKAQHEGAETPRCIVQKDGHDLPGGYVNAAGVDVPDDQPQQGQQQAQEADPQPRLFFHWSFSSR